jgi:ribulose-bisphosphate carboxylase large chain
MKKNGEKKTNSKFSSLSCDWKVKYAEKSKASGKSTIYRYKGSFGWKGVKKEVYKHDGDDWSKIFRRVLIGDNVTAKSHVRYFEIAPGGNSSFERHRHEHIVIGLRGKGRVRLDKRYYKVNFLDVVYVSSDTPHQFLNPFSEPFGFLCIVPAKRDRPVLMKR